MFCDKQCPAGNRLKHHSVDRRGVVANLGRFGRPRKTSRRDAHGRACDDTMQTAILTEVQIEFALRQDLLSTVRPAQTTIGNSIRRAQEPRLCKAFDKTGIRVVSPAELSSRTLLHCLPPLYRTILRAAIHNNLRYGMIFPRDPRLTKTSSPGSPLTQKAESEPSPREKASHRESEAENERGTLPSMKAACPISVSLLRATNSSSRELAMPGSEALLDLLLFSRLLLGSFDLIRQFVFRTGREVLHIICQIIRRRQCLPANRRLAAGEERT